MDFTLNFCEYNRSNSDYDRIFRPEGSGDFLFLLFKTPMKVYLGGQLTVTRENACIFYIPGNPQHYQAVRKFRNSYVHFSCGENLAKRFGLPCNEIFYPSDCQEIDHCIQKLQHESEQRSFFPGLRVCPALPADDHSLAGTPQYRYRQVFRLGALQPVPKNPSGNAYKLRKAMDNRKALRHG